MLHGATARIACLCMLALVSALAWTPEAFAHAKFVSFSPSGERALATPPDEVAITYSKDLTTVFREATLVAPNGKRRSLEPRIDGARALLDMPDTMEGGTWKVEWLVRGPDGHPQREERTFSVERASASESSSFPADTWRTISLAGRIIFFASLLLFVGGGTFALFAARGFMPRAWGVMAANTVLGAVFVLAAHEAVSDRRSLLALIDPIGWVDAAMADGGRGYALAAVVVVVAWRLGGAALQPAAWQRREGRPPWLLVALLAIAVAAPTLSSHATTGDSAALRIPLDMIHVGAAAIWVGGLAQLLALTVRRRDVHPGIPNAIERYSRMALASVATLVITGAFAAWTELDGDLSALVDDGYGRLVTVKIVLLLLAMPLARINQKRHVPGVRDGAADAFHGLRRFVRMELVIAAWIVVATAALVHETPPGDGAGASHASHLRSTTTDASVHPPREDD